jgi:hypothetical protein
MGVEKGVAMASPEKFVHDDLSDLEDGQLWTTLITGLTIGVPLAFVLALALVASVAPWPGALLIALWAAIVAGPFIGALATLIAQAARESRAMAPATNKTVQPTPRANQPRIA